MKKAKTEPSKDTIDLIKDSSQKANNVNSEITNDININKSNPEPSVNNIQKTSETIPEIRNDNLPKLNNTSLNIQITNNSPDKKSIHTEKPGKTIPEINNLVKLETKKDPVPKLKSANNFIKQEEQIEYKAESKSISKANEVKPQNSPKKPDTPIKPDTPEMPIDQLVLKSGASDLRRQEKTLSSLIEHNLEEGVKKGVTYGFCNSSNNTIKLMKANENGSISLFKIKSPEPFEWPAFQEKGKEGYTVTLEGKEKEQFLKDKGIPNI